MFEKEIKFIADYNLNKVKSFGSFITFERLLSSSMHPAVIQYISAELDYLISEDRKRILRESVFDYSGQETFKYFNLIAQEIKKTKEISFEDLKKLVIQAVSFNLNFLARPKWSLSKLIYNDEQNRTIEEIKLNLNYIYFYDYIKSIFLSYISKRKLTALSITEFELILNKIDNELFATQPQKLVDYSLYSIAEFFNLGDVNKTKVPILALELFLKEKNLMDYLFRLRKAVPEDANQKYELEDIKIIIYSSSPIDARPIKKEEKSYNKETIKKDEVILPEEKQAELFFPSEEIEIELPVYTKDEKYPVEDIIDEQLTEETVEEEIARTEEEPEIVNNEDEDTEEIIEEEIEVQGKVNEPMAPITESEPEAAEIEEESAAEPVDNLIEPVQESEQEQLEESVPEEIAPEDFEAREPEPENIEPAEELPEEQPEEVQPEMEDISIPEIPDEESEKIVEPEDRKDAVEAAAPDEEINIEDISEPVTAMSDEDFFSLFSEEVKKAEEDDPDLKPEIKNDEPEPEKKEDVDSFLDFEEETENLLRAFKETEEEMNLKDIDIFKDTTSKTDKAAMDLIKNFHEETDDKKNEEPAPSQDIKTKPVKKNGKYKEKKIRNILDSISNNDIEKIIANVFNEDKEDFTSTMEKLNECSNYDEATEILKSVFVTYRVNPYTKDALTLTNSVANYFTKV